MGSRWFHFIFVCVIFVVIILIIGGILYYLNNNTSKKATSFEQFLSKKLFFLQLDGYHHNFDRKISLILNPESSSFVFKNCYNSFNISGKYRIDPSTNIVTLVLDDNKFFAELFMNTTNQHLILVSSDANDNIAKYQLIENTKPILKRSYSFLTAS